MKINQEMRAQVESASSQQQKHHMAEKGAFDQLIASETQKTKQQNLQQFMDSITRQGDKLARFRSFQDFAKFKRMIQDFLQEIVSGGLNLSRSYRFSMNSQNRQLVLVRKIDEKLLQLADELMNQEERTVDLLGLIGEIKGLLMNVYQ